MTHSEDTVRIPLRARDGSVRAYALIDVVDAAFIGQWRWSLNSTGYAVRTITVNGHSRKIRLHREILGLPHVFDGREGDHIDRDRLNDRRGNLRVVTRAQNNQNRPSGHGSSSHRGVRFNPKLSKWIAQVGVNRKRIEIGSFNSEAEAAEAAKAARARLLPYAVN